MPESLLQTLITDPIMSTKSNLTLLLSSLAAGAALGLLLAPTSGRETRRNLIRRGEEMKDKLSDLYEEGTQYVNRGKQQFSEVADRAKDKVQDATSVSGSTSRNAGSTTPGGGGNPRPTTSAANGGARS